MAVVSFSKQEDTSINVSRVIECLDYHGVGAVKELCCRDEVLANDDDVQSLEEYLRRHHRQVTLQTLKLPNNRGLFRRAGRRGSRAVARILRTASSTLTEVDLSNNLLAADGLAALVEDGALLTTTGAGGGGGCVQNSDGCCCCNVRTLHLSHNRLCCSRAAGPISNLFRYNNSIRHLNLSHNSLGPSTMKKVVAGLCQNSTIRRLDLSYNKLGDRGTKLLSSCLDPTATASTTSPNHKNHCQLRDLDLTYNKIGPTGVKHITKALLNGNTTLTKLDLSLNVMEPSGAESIAAALKYSYTLTELIVSRNNILDDGCISICHSLAESYAVGASGLRTLDLSWNGLTDASVTVLANDVLKQNSVLETLNLASNAITDRGVIELSRALPSDLALQELNIVGNQVTDPGAVALAEVLCTPRPRCRLKRLYWEKNHFTEVGEERLQSVFVFRNHLEHWLNRQLREIERRRSLQLDLRNRNLGDEELIALSNSLAKHGPQVTTAFLGGQRVTRRGVEALSELVLTGNNSCGNCKMMRLYLSGSTRMGDAGAAVVARALCTNATMTVLSLSNCNMKHAGAEQLANALRRNRRLKRLHLEGNQIGDCGFRVLFDSILRGRVECPSSPSPSSSSSVVQLASLNVSNNNITDDGLCNLTSTGCLQELYLADNTITDRGALDLAKACLVPNRLQFLDVSGNRITRKGVQALQLFLSRPGILDCSNQKK